MNGGFTSVNWNCYAIAGLLNNYFFSLQQFSIVGYM